MGKIFNFCAYALLVILGTFLPAQRVEATTAADSEGRAVSAPAPVSKPLAAVAPDRIIVKFKDSLTAPADQVFASGGSFAAVTVSRGDELDRMNERFGVRSIVPLFEPHSPAHGQNRLWQTRSGRSEIFTDSFNKVNQKYARRSARAKQQSQLPDLSHIYVLTLPVGIDIAAVCRSYAANPNVVYAVPSQVMQPQAFVNDPYFSSQGSWGNSYDDLWALKKIKADVAWDTARGDGVVVAVVDTGLDYTHPDIAANVWPNSAEKTGTTGVDDDGNGFIDDVRGVSFEYVDQKLVGRSEVMDTDGHGTFVAGIIAAVGDNNAGTVGVAPDATIMPVRVMASEGFGNTEPYANGILYAAMNGADIINLSWGCSDCQSSAGNPVVADAIAVAQGLGAIVVTSADNQRSDVKDAFPAGLEQVITVAASDENDANSPFSNRGYLVDLAAPGGGGWQGGIVDHFSILSLRSSQAGTTAGQPVGSGYLRGSGTSASAAYVSGVAALLLSANPALTGEQVAAILRKSADDQLGSTFDTPGYDPYLGWGRLNAARAVAMALAPPADPPLLTVPDPGFNFNIPQTLCGQERSFSFDIYNTGGGTLNWSLAAPSWLAPLTFSGANFSSPVLKIMADQPVSGGVSITSNGSGSGSLNLPVTVAVRPDIKLTNCAMPIATAAGNQEWDKARNPNPPAIPDGAGGAYYVWYGPASFTPGDYKIFLQHLDSSGTLLWPADGIRVSSADKFQYNPTLISDGAGGVVVLWIEGLNTIDYADKNISVQRVNSAGQLLWGTGGVHVTQGGNVVEPVIVPDGLGGALIGWTHLGANDDLYVQRVSASGALLWQQSGYPLSVASDEQFALRGIADGSGGAWFTWIDRRNPMHDVYAQHLDRDGAPLWPANGRKLNQASAGSTEPNLVSDGAGGAIIAWYDFRNHPMSGDAYYSAGHDIFAVHLDSSGQDLWSPAEQQLLSGTAVAHLGGANMLSDGQGGAILAWLDIRNQNTAVSDKKEIYSQRINGAGQPL